PPGAIERYRRRISGPLRDRFDLSMELPALPWAELRGGPIPEASATVRARVDAARDRQRVRQGTVNARLDGAALRSACRLDDAAAERLLASGVARLQLSARSVTRVLRVARTIADLSARDAIAREDVAEALQFRT